MDCFYCAVKAGKLLLKEHEDARWLKPEEMDSVAWLPADREIIEKLRNE